MTVMTSYAHGVPSWVDLATPDPTGARAFYGELFDWNATEEPTDRPGVSYTMARKGDHAAAGMMLLSDEMAASGMPPVWTTYVTVDDLDATVAKVAPAGGTVLQPPFDVMDSGRMAVLADPAGAVISLWQAKEHVGCEVVNEHGAYTWAELITPDPAVATEFYGAVLGWRSQTMPMSTGEDYTVFMVDGGSENGIAGAMAPPVPGMPSFWSVYFHVDDAAATVAAAERLGASVLMPVTTMAGVGTMASLADPQGAAFAVMTPENAS